MVKLQPRAVCVAWLGLHRPPLGQQQAVLAVAGSVSLAWISSLAGWVAPVVFTW